MIYLLQDCYLDDNNECQKILKIGYSDKPFNESREKQYNTHNFGYKFLGEREGSKELESYLQGLFDSLRLGGEWFRYDQEIIKKFGKVDESEVFSIPKEEYLEELRVELISNVPSVFSLKEKHLKEIISWCLEKSENYPDIYGSQEEVEVSFLKKNILNTFELFRDTQIIQIDEFIKEISLDLPQIVGRQRDKTNPFKNHLVLFYKTKRSGEEELTKEAFDLLQKERRKLTKDLLNLFEKANDTEKAGYLLKLKDSIQVSKYSRDFVSISKTSNLPVYNPLIEISNERAWEVAQEDYQDKISVTKAIEKLGFGVTDTESPEERIVSEFLETKFYSTGIFREKLKAYCEFSELWKNNQEILQLLNFKIKDTRYQLFYNYFGMSGCKSKNYEEFPLMSLVGDSFKERQLVAEIIITFKEGEVYTAKDIKLILSNIYSRFSISRAPKATDLKDYFSLEETKLFNQETGKRDKAYRIKEKKD